MDKFPITVEGFERLQAELKQLKHVERPAVIEAIGTARELGDLSENAEYHAAREKQSFIEGRIAELEDKQARAEIIDTKVIDGKTVKFGATVTVVDEENDSEATYHITGEYEADITKNFISISSPLARALIGKDEGTSVEVTTPRGVRYYEILKVKYA